MNLNCCLCSLFGLAGSRAGRPPSSAMRRLRLTPQDALFGFSRIIDCTWFFPGQLAPASLRRSLAAVAQRTLLPLSWRVARGDGDVAARRPRPPFSGWELRPCAEAQGVPLIVRQYAGSDTFAEAAARAHAREDGGLAFVEAGTGGLSSCAEVMDGREPVLAVVLTQFGEDGRDGSAVGVRASHAACDAAGLHRVVAEWGRLHRALDTGDTDAASWSRTDRTDRTDRTAVFAAAKAAAGPERGGDPRGGVDLSGWRGSALWWCMRKLSALGERRAGARPARALLSFRGEELAALVRRANARRANAGAGRTAPHTVGKGEALCGALVRELVRPLHAPTTTGAQPSPPRSYRVAMPVDLRGGRAGLDLSSEYTGNAVHTLCTPAVVPDGADGAPADCAFTRVVHDLGRSVRETPETVAGEWARHFANLGHGRLVAGGAGGDDDGSVTVVANSQRHLMRTTTLAPELALFGPAGGRCVRVLPGPSDTIQLLPQAIGDGVDVLINLPTALALPSERRRGPEWAVPPEDWRARVESPGFRRAVLGQ